MLFLQLVLSLDKMEPDLILFCRWCHSDSYRNNIVPGQFSRDFTLLMSNAYQPHIIPISFPLCPQ